jgi:transcriptional regulatory protein ASH1
VLRFDKPGFDLLNDAILLTELKQQLEQQYTSKKPSFNSRISSKMMSPDSRKNYTFHKNMSESLSDDESSVFHHWNHTLSPISKQTQIENNSSSSNYHHQISISTSQQHNYTYKTTQPSSPTQQYVPSRSSPLTSPQPSHPKVASSSANEPVMSSWSGHHNTENPVVLKTETFIHTQNHKGPNHTYTIHHHNLSKRKCISCHSDQSPCWRPSWSTTAGQLCNSCGLRYKKTGARCTIDSCRRIPAKGEWAAMKQRGKVEVLNSSGEKTLGYSCLNCSGEVEVKEKK